MRYTLNVLRSIASIFIFVVLVCGCVIKRPVTEAIDLTTKISRQPGLVSFWDFRDSSGFPAAGTANKLRLKPAFANRYLATGPLSGHSISFDGVKDYWSISSDSSTELNLKNVTIIAWVRWSGGTGFVAGKWNESADGGKRQYGLFVSLPYYNGANQVCGHISRNGGATKPFPYSIDYSASPQTVVKDEWTCVAFTYDGKYIRSYVNGVFKSREEELISTLR